MAIIVSASPLPPAPIQAIQASSVASLQSPVSKLRGALRAPISNALVETVVIAHPQGCALPGDIDDNGVVERADLDALAGHWGAKEGEANFDPALDLDGNGSLDVVDLMRVSARLGAVCPANASAAITGYIFNAGTDKPLAGATISSAGNLYSATSDTDGFFSLAVAPGEYQLGIAKSGFTADERILNASANQTVRVQDILLYPLDSQTAAVDTSGGMVENSLNNSSLDFPAGAVASNQQVRVTYLPNDALPGNFPDGSIPMGFSYFEPGGLVFPQGKEVLWTVAYDGDLPVGTDTLCYWWDGGEGRWRDPVPGKVVQLPGGGKALQARVPHFSASSQVQAGAAGQLPPRGAAYGHALPGVAGQQPGQGGTPTVSQANANQGPCQTHCPGSQINVGAGSVTESYPFLPVSSKGFSVLLVARYSTSNDTPTVTARVPFTITTQFPASAQWQLEFQGKLYTGEGMTAEAAWDTHNDLGYRVAPGLYPFKASETFIYDSGARPTLEVNGLVEVRRGDIWPFGHNWMTAYDALLVDHGDTATIIQGDGQYLTYTRQPDGSYTPPSDDFSTLVRAADGTWIRTSKMGFRESFNSTGRLTRLEDRNGNAQTLAYEPNGITLATGQWGVTTRLSSITDSSGRAFTFDYGADGYIAHVTDPLNRIYTLAHDNIGNLTGITDPLGRATTYQYDSAGLMTRYVYPNNSATTLTYDAQRRMTTHTDALGEGRTATYSSGGNTVTDERGNATTYIPNQYGAITRIQTPVQTFNYTFDDARHLSAVDQPPQRFRYDVRGNLTESSGFASTSVTYDTTFNLPASMTDGAGNTTQFAYDAHGNLTTVTDAAGNVSHFEYDAVGQMVRATDPLNESATVSYDTFGNPLVLTDPLGFQTTLAYDAAGNLIKATNAQGHSSQFAYDAVARLSTATDALNHVTQYAYDANDNLTSLTDAHNNATTYTYDALDRLTRETNALGKQTNYRYDAAGNLDRVSDANGAVTNYTYDAANRLVAEQLPDGGATYRYDNVNGLAGFVDSSTAVSYTYTSGIPGAPDVAQTRLLDQPGLLSTISYDYVAAGSTSLAAAGLDHPQLPAPSAQSSAPTQSLPAWRQALAGQPPSSSEPAPWMSTPEPTEVNSAALAAYQETPAETHTDVCGTISANTTWTLANSPYIVTCDVTVNSGVTLTIEPGVVVKFTACCVTLNIYGTLHASGTEGQPIYFTSINDNTVGGNTGSGNPVSGSWGAVVFRGESTGSIMNHSEVRYGGGYWTGNVYVYTPNVTLTNNTLTRANGAGLRLENALPAALTNNHFVDNTDVAVGASLSGNTQSITLSGNTASGNKVNGFVTAGTIAGNVTWDGDDGFPFVIWGDMTVNTGARLTLAPRTVLKFYECCHTLNVYGTLIADSDSAGSPLGPIIFTSLKDDAIAGDTNGDGSASQPAPGLWGAVVFRGESTGSIMNHSEVRYGGGYWTGNVYVYTPNVTLTNNTLTRASGAGLRLENALPAALTNNHFVDNTDVAVGASLSGNTQSITLSGNTASGNKVNGFVTAGTIAGNVTWDGDDGFPFVIWGDMTVNTGARLTLAPRTVLKFYECCHTLNVYGTLIADSDSAGSPLGPIIFTSLKDDAIAGDTNGDGSASQPAPGLWGAVVFRGESTGSIMNHAEVRYGGGYWTADVYAYTGSVTLTNNSLTRANGAGLHLEAGSPTLTGNSFIGNGTGVYIAGGAGPVLHDNRISGNSDYGVQNAGGAALINAENNWWGSSEGPADSSDDRASGGFYNPDGQGDRVSDGVDYDPWLRLTGLLYGVTIATGNNPVQTVRYSYDPLNRLSSLTASGGAPGAASFTTGYTYDAGGRLTALAPVAGQPGVKSTLEYDANARLTHLVNRSPDGSTSFNDFRYTYDKLGNLLTEKDGSNTTTYTYDALYQLKSVSGPGLNESYSYDEVGNRTTKNGVTYNYNAGNQLVSSSDGATYTYDNNGNLRSKTTGGQTTTYTWDVRNRLTRIDFADNSFAAYTYDGLDRRISKRDRTGALTYYIYNGLNLVQELDANGMVIASYVYSGLDHPTSMTRGGASYYYLFDLLGNVVGLADGAGQTVATYRYDPWGNVIATGGSNPNLVNPFRFTSREWDAESGLYFYRARYYDPQVGRFISRDPLRLLTMEPNAYVYVGNNPVNLSDAMGLDVADRRWWQSVYGIGAGLVGGAVAVGMAPVAAGATLVAVSATLVGGVAGGLVGVIHEGLTAPPCDRSLWGAFGAGGKGGLVGGSIAGTALAGGALQGAIRGTEWGEATVAAWNSGVAGARSAATLARELAAAIMRAPKPRLGPLGPKWFAEYNRLNQLREAALAAENWDKAIALSRQILSMMPPLP